MLVDVKRCCCCCLEQRRRRQKNDLDYIEQEPRLDFYYLELLLFVVAAVDFEAEQLHLQKVESEH